MTDLSLTEIPELEGDENLQQLIDTFDARLVAAQTKHHYVGTVSSSVRIGEDDYIRLPSVRLTLCVHKAELERARASLFAAWLIRQSQEEARRVWKLAAQWEGKEFMAWVREDVEWKRQMMGAA